MHSPEKHEYDPAHYYFPLTGIAADPHALLEILFEQASTALPHDVLHNRAQIKDQMLVMCPYIQSHFIKILKREKIWSEIEGNLSWKSGQRIIPSVEEVCRLVKGKRKRKRIRRKLGKVRDSLTPDFLEMLGFMPEEVFSREDYEQMRRKKCSASYNLLHETFPKWVKPEWIENPRQFLHALPKLEKDERDEFPKLYERCVWMKEAEDTFQRCIREAFRCLTVDLREKMIPKDAMTQPYSLHSDLSTKSAIELLEIVLDTQNTEKRLRRRFDALQILEYAIKFFEVLQNPIYKAQFEVRKDLHEILNIEVWDEGMDISRTPVVRSAGRFRPLFVHDRGKRDADMYVITRQVREEMQGIFRNFCDVVDPESVPAFDSRPKTHISYVIKETLMQEMVRKCLAKLEGAEVDGIETKQDARKSLGKTARRMKKRFGKNVFPEKPAALDIIDDGVGLMFTVALKEPLRKLQKSPRKRNRVESCMEEIKHLLVDVLGLEDVQKSENNLWSNDAENPKRSRGFREMKFHASKSTELEDGTKVKVPVEIQLQPLEVHLAAHSPGAPEHVDAYGERKARDLTRRIMPASIGGASLFPRTDTGELAEIL